MKTIKAVGVLLIILLSSPQYTNAQVTVIRTIAGDGIASFRGDSGLATAAGLNNPMGLATDPFGNVYVADNGNNRVRKIDLTGIITTIAGNGIPGYNGDGIAATAGELNHPTAVATDAYGDVFISDSGNGRIREVNSKGIISTVAGNGKYGFNGDGGQASAAEFAYPMGLTVDAAGNIYVADNGNYRIRKINTSGIVNTIAGTNIAGGYNDNGISATTAELYSPFGIVADQAGNIYISEGVEYSYINRISPDGHISNFAGAGKQAFSGDGGEAVVASLNAPWGMAMDANGNMYIADHGNNRVRGIGTDGVIITIAGGGSNGLGDGGYASTAELNNPSGIAIDGAGDIFVSDQGNNRIREIYRLYPPKASFTVSNLIGGVCDGSTFQFADTSTHAYNNCPSHWLWAFPGGIPQYSTEQNPKVVYNTPGVYSIQLTVYNLAGADSLKKTAYITNVIDRGIQQNCSH